MRTSILFLVLWSLNFLFGQDLSISDFSGFDDSSGNTHLIYRVNNYNKDLKWTDVDIYHYDDHTKTDSIFLNAGGYCDNDQSCYSEGIIDLIFLHNDPNKYIYINFGCGFDCNWEIYRYDQQTPLLTGGWGYIWFYTSKQDDSLYFFYTGGTTDKSTDGGKSWNILSTEEYLISVNPFNDNHLFCYNKRNLTMTVDAGNSFSIADTGYYDIPKLHYDIDKQHIYLVYKNIIKMSDNNGEENSWKKIYKSMGSEYLSMSIDSIPGHLFIADGKDIFSSEDFGKTFIPLKTCDNNIIGIYKKPFSNRLFVATKYNILKLDGLNETIIKQFVVGVRKGTDVPEEFSLKQNYPNPFNPNTNIEFNVPSTGEVVLKIYDIIGQEITTLINEVKDKGTYNVNWNGEDQFGNQVSSGTYFYTLSYSDTTGIFRKNSKKMTVIK